MNNNFLWAFSVGILKCWPWSFLEEDLRHFFCWKLTSVWPELAEKMFYNSFNNLELTKLETQNLKKSWRTVHKLLDICLHIYLQCENWSKTPFKCIIMSVLWAVEGIKRDICCMSLSFWVYADAAIESVFKNQGCVNV